MVEAGVCQYRFFLFTAAIGSLIAKVPVQQAFYEAAALLPVSDHTCTMRQGGTALPDKAGADSPCL